MPDWIPEWIDDLPDWMVRVPLVLLALLLFGAVLRWLLHKMIDRLIRRTEARSTPDRVAGAASTRRVQRSKAIGGLFKSIVTIVVIAVIGTSMLSEVGVEIAPILASAGVVGLAIGFGAQSLVRDYLAGIFIILEDQYGVGDVVDVGEASGTVELVTLRMTQLRDVDGTVWYVPNGEILRVGNKSQNWARAVLDISVGYSEDLVKVRRVLEEVAHDMWDDEDFQGRIIEEPEVWGVEGMTADGITVRVTLKTAPMEQWAIAREMRQRIKARFDHEGIEIPFPQRVVWHRDVKPGATADTAAPEKPLSE